MDRTTGTAGRARSTSRKEPSQTAIVFGSAAAHPARKPASVRATCEAIGLPRSTYYYQSHRSSEAIALEQKIVQRLLELSELRPNDGYRRMTLQLQREGFHVNRKRIARLMHLHNLGVRTQHPEQVALRNRRVPSPVSAPREGSEPTAANQVWIADLAYVHILSGLIYTAAIIDVGSREVVGYAASTHINPRLPAIALHSAVRAHRPALGCIHHSTYGIQYVMRGYRELLRQYGLIPGASDPVEAPALQAALWPVVGTARQIIEMTAYNGWDDVVARVDEFVRGLYSAQRIEAVINSYVRNGGRESSAAGRCGYAEAGTAAPAVVGVREAGAGGKGPALLIK